MDFLNRIIEKIANLPTLIDEKLHVTDHFNNVLNGLSDLKDKVIDSVLGLPDRVRSAFTGFFESVYNWFGNVVDRILELPDKILDIIKRVFIPEDGYMDGKLGEIKVALGRLGIGTYNMSSIFSSKKGIDDVTVKVMGSTGTILRSDIVIKGINYFRPAIRGFIALMLIFYNFNQFCSLIGHQGVSIAGLFGGSGGGEQSVGKGEH